MAHAPVGTYQTVGTLTADPAQLTLMLFDGACRNGTEECALLRKGGVVP